MTKLEVFDPAMCCPTGVCGPSVDPALVQFAADLEWIRGKGIEVERWNLSQRPDVFAQNETVARALRDAKGQGLPMILVDGTPVAKDAYPTREQLAGWLGIEFREDSREGPVGAEGQRRVPLTVVSAPPGQCGCGPKGCC